MDLCTSQVSGKTPMKGQVGKPKEKISSYSAVVRALGSGGQGSGAPLGTQWPWKAWQDRLPWER